jgi:hypothetical protein
VRPHNYRHCASSTKMHLQLQYELGQASYLAHRRLLQPGVPAAFVKGYMSWCALVAGVSFLGVVTAIIAQNLILVIVFAAILAGIAFHATAYRKHYEAALLAEAARLPVRAVSLRIDEAGLHESVCGVESFAPWNAVVSYAATSDTLAFELASGYWSLIPLTAFGRPGEEAAAPLMTFLQEWSIPKKVSP